MELSDSKVELVARKNKVVYQDGNRVVKVFNGTKPAGDVFNEALNVARIAETPIKHPHVLEVSQVADGSWALATEYVPGKTLAALMAEEGADFDAFCAALNEVTSTLCRMIAKDGEGASRLLTCQVTGGKTVKDAKLCAKAVVCSSLLKAAIFGADANWGRVLCALGYSGAELNVKAVNVAFRSSVGSITVCRDGASVDFSEEEAKKIHLQDEIDVVVTLHDGDASATAWGCDLTYDYVKINGDYRS